MWPQCSSGILSSDSAAAKPPEFSRLHACTSERRVPSSGSPPASSVKPHSVSLPPISPMPPACQPPTVHSTTKPHVGSVLNNDDLVNLSAALLRVHHCAAAGRELRRASAAASLTRALEILAAAPDLCHINSEVHGVHGSHHSKSSTSPPARLTMRPSPNATRSSPGAPELARSSEACTQHANRNKSRGLRASLARADNEGRRQTRPAHVPVHS